jgi:hypothetical protein
MRVGPTDVRIALIALNVFVFFVLRERVLVGETGLSVIGMLFLAFSTLTVLALAVIAILTARNLMRKKAGDSDEP